MPYRDKPVAVAAEVPSELLAKASKEGRRAYRIAVGGWALLGLIGVFGGLRYFIEGPTASSVIGEELTGWWDEGWSAAWIISGLLVMYGVLRPKWWAELYGQIIFFWALVPYTVAVFDRAGMVVGFYLPLAIIGASGLRIWYLIRYARRVRFVIGEPPVGGIRYGRRSEDIREHQGTL